MDTTTAPTPPAAAPAAITPPAAPAATAVPSTLPINSVTKKPISEAAHNLFKMLEESGDPLREEAPAEDKPKETAPAKPDDKPAGPTADDEGKPIKVSKKVAKRPELPIPKEETPAAPVATPTPTDSKWEESLLDDEKAALEDARFAETVNPKHKGLAEKMGKFFRDQKKYLEEHPDADENDPGYKKILAQQPALSSLDKREIADARIVSRVNKEHEGKFADLEHELFVRDEEPKVENDAMAIRRQLAFNALPKEMLDVLKEKGLPVLQKEYADELEVAGGLINTLVDDAKELLRITRVNPKTKRPLGTVAADQSHPKWDQHNRIATMVNEVCNDFHKNAPESEKVRDGKWFVTREEWAKLPAASRSQFWTFTNSDAHVREMIDRAMGWMPGAIKQQIEARHNSLKARGYVRHREAPPAAPAVPPVASSSPSSPRPSPSPAPNSTPAGTLTPGQALARRLAES